MPKPPITKPVIDRSQYQSILSQPINGGTNNILFDRNPSEVDYTGLGHQRVSGSIGGGDLVTKKGNEYFLYNKNNTGQGLVSIGNINTPQVALAPTLNQTANNIVKNNTPNPPDVTHQSVQFGTAGVYNPNNNTTTDYNGKVITPIVQQYSNGGKITPKPPIKSKPQIDTKGLAEQKKLLGLKKGGLVPAYDNGGVVNPEDSNSVAPEETDPTTQTPSKFTKYINDNQQGITNGIGGLSQLSQVVGLGIDATNTGGINDKLNVDKSTLSGGLKGFGKGAALGASVGSVIGPEGTLIGAGIGAIGGGIAGAINGHSQAKGINQDIQNQLDATALAKKKTDANNIFQSNLSRQLAQRQASYADGGIIKGKGNGTSDSITAKVKSDSFIVPAKNAETAEIIRKVILKAPNKKANLNQENGEKVKLSNNEHLFTPKEVEKIENVLGDNVLDKLAPNSARLEDISEGEKNEVGLYRGGPIPGVSDKLNSSKNKTTSGYPKKVADKIITNKNGLTVDEMKKLTPYINNGDIQQNIVPETTETAKKLGTTINTTPSNNPVSASTKKGLSSKFDLSKLSDLGDAAEATIPFLQAGYGLSQLHKLGKRPVGELDPDYLKSINQAQSNVDLANANAQFGFSPEEQAQINNDNTQATNVGRFDARNLSGGSAANAYNMERGVINNSFNNALKAKVANRDLILQKQGIANDRQQYLDGLRASKANMSRTLFNDKMNAFQQNQESAAGLLGSGLQNLIGLKRYQDEKAANQNTQNIRNSTYNSIGQ